MENYETVVDAINGLKDRGYVLDFNIAFDKITCSQDGSCLNPAEFEIMETYRFEGETNPSDEDVVYAIESKDRQQKGVLTSAFGIYADEVDANLLKKLRFHHD